MTGITFIRVIAMGVIGSRVYFARPALVGIIMEVVKITKVKVKLIAIVSFAKGCYSLMAGFMKDFPLSLVI